MDLNEQIKTVVRDAVAEALTREPRPRGLSIEAAARYLGGTSPQAVKALIEAGELPALKVGNRTYIGTPALDDLLARGAVVQPRRTG